eukprot:TRINITY_DN6278_c0_g1_i1.p1 TRINITY_DN6278_c0_g1~~TRINITY_DN6278_c0_g1_i1.p1  ORF type:complete len:137 (-),score=30.22 TRINITY_DN6278_c0_g1_i1:376-786(-)
MTDQDAIIAYSLVYNNYVWSELKAENVPQSVLDNTLGIINKAEIDFKKESEQTFQKPDGFDYHCLVNQGVAFMCVTQGIPPRRAKQFLKDMKSEYNHSYRTRKTQGGREFKQFMSNKRNEYENAETDSLTSLQKRY